jgi:hypothetical protein
MRTLPPRKRFILSLFAVLSGALLFISCAHAPQDPTVQEVYKSTQVFDASEKIVVRAITQVLKDRGFGASKVEKTGEDESRLFTDFVPQGEWRTKIEATIKKLSRKEREVTLVVTTEQKESGPAGWKTKILMGKEQYEKIFNEIEMQIYREWAKGD